MASLMYQWSQQTWRNYEQLGAAGDPLTHVASNQFSRMGVSAGDLVYVVGQADGELLLIARMRVDGELLGQKEAELRAGVPLYEADEHAFGFDEAGVLSFERIVPEAIARSLEFEDGRRLLIDRDRYRLDRQTLRAPGWLIDDSARALDEVIDAWPGIPPEIADLKDETAHAAGKRGRRGRRVSAAARRAVELHAMELAAKHYRAEDWDVNDVSASESYDLRCRRGAEVRWVEVKGTTSSQPQVVLTANEVELAEDPETRSGIVFVSEIELDDPEAKAPVATGGRVRVIDPWKIEEGELWPIAYGYRLPG